MLDKWLGRSFLIKTFEDDVELTIDENRALLDMDDECGEDVG